MNALIQFILIVWWIHGIALAEGFWMTLLSFVLPPVAWVISMASFL